MQRKVDVPRLKLAINLACPVLATVNSDERLLILDMLNLLQVSGVVHLLFSASGGTPENTNMMLFFRM